jgi:hypothetical protein
MWKRIGNRLTDMNSKLIAQYLSWQDWIRYIRTAINTIRELDTALVDLRKTTTMSTDELREFYYSANDTAQEMGVTTAEIINQASAWSRLGYSSKEAATEMSALSSQFAQISPGMDVDKATDGLVSTMKAFGFEVEDVERNVMDNINRIGNTMATSNDEIVDMLERSSAAMAAANNTIEETIALESAAVQVTRNAETTGTAFRTISMRIRGYDEETEEQLEDYEELKGKIADLTKTAKTPGGISLFSDKDKTTFKSTYQLLKDISEIQYNELGYNKVVYELTCEVNGDSFSIQLSNTIKERSSFITTSLDKDGKTIYLNYLSNVAKFYYLQKIEYNGETYYTKANFKDGSEYKYISYGQGIQTIDLINDYEVLPGSIVSIYLLFDYNTDNIQKIYSDNLGTSGGDSDIFFREDLEFRMI